MRINRFNQQGITRFAACIDSARAGEPGTDARSLVSDPALVEVVGEVDGLPALGADTSRREAAELLAGLIEQLSPGDHERDKGLWAWLSAVWFDDLCPADSDGRRKPGDTARWIPAVDDFKKYYRHLLAGPYRVLRAHQEDPDRAMAVLATSVSKPGDAVEQLVSRQEIVTSPTLMALATELYYDPETGSLKPGAGGKGPGSPRRFGGDIVPQFALTFDLHDMPVERLKHMLPIEFDRFR